MAQFIPYNDAVEVSSESIRSIINSLEVGKENRIVILAKNGIRDLKDGEWLSQKSMLNSLRDIYNQLGSNTLFTIGKAIPSAATFPKEVDNLQMALTILDLAYQNNHRGGKIGSYTLK